MRNKGQLLRPTLAPWSKEGSAEAVGPATFRLVSGTEGGGPDKLAVDTKGRRPAVIKPRVVRRWLPPFEVLVMRGDIKAQPQLWAPN